jgi:hypothetical protein
MRRFAVLFALLLALVLTACAAYEAQHSGSAPSGPGNAPFSQAPSGEFAELPVGAQCARVRGEVDTVKGRLAAEGKYECCVRPACSECLLRYGECHCQHSARHAGPSCGECTEAWLEGRGAVEGLTAKEMLQRLEYKGGDGPVWDQVEGGEPPHEHHH